MKNILPLAFLIFFGVQTSTLSGQNRFALSLEGGPSYTHIHGNSANSDYLKPILGGFGGIAFQYSFLDKLSFKTGIAYERKGADLLVNSIMLNYTFHFDYLTIPLLIKASIGKKLRFLVSAGPYFSYLINQTYINNHYYPYNFEYPIPDQSTYENANKLDFGIIGCIGIEVRIKNQYALSLEVRDHYGLVNTKLFPDFVGSDGMKYNFDNNAINNSIILSLGFSYFFPSGKGKIIQ